MAKKIDNFDYACENETAMRESLGKRDIVFNSSQIYKLAS